MKEQLLFVKVLAIEPFSFYKRICGQCLFLICLLCFNPLLGSAQSSPPEPCDDGTQATCRCQESPVLCTVDDLDGFEFSMSTFQHPEDGPNPLCIGVPSVPNNPTWFAFIAWCETLTLNVEISNCTDVCSGTNGAPCGTGLFPCGIFGNCTRGVQIAIYGDCAYTEQVACNVNDCGNENNKTLNMNNLVVGKTYYFMVDGCGGSACDIRINIVGTCGSAEIEDWNNPIEGPDRVCIGDAGSYTVDQLSGATDFHWYLDGVEIAVTSSNSISLDWLSAGVYELCVDASNDPCIPLGEGPGQICMTIQVDEIFPEDPEPVEICAGETYFYPQDGLEYGPGVYTLSFQSVAGCDSTITLTVLGIDEASENLGFFFPCDGEEIEIGGQTFTDGGEYTIVIQQQAAPFCDSIIEFIIVPIFADAGDIMAEPQPACPGELINIFVNNAAESFQNIQYTIVTDIEGRVLALQAGTQLNFSSDDCLGIYTVYSYNFDETNPNPIPTVGSFFDENFCQTECCDISVLEIFTQDNIPPVFTTPPSNITIENIDDLPPLGSLNWTDNCGSTGESTGTQTGSFDPCAGGILTRVWNASDPCGNASSHLQRIEILPDPDACSDPCDISVLDLIQSPCDNNQTGFDESDDFFYAQFRVVLEEGESSAFLVVIEGDTLGPFDYNSAVVLDTLPATGDTLLVQIIGLDNPACRTSFQLNSDPCSSCPQSISAGTGGIITCSNSSVVLTGSASEPGIFQWSGPDGFSSDNVQILADRPGMYFLTVTFEFGCVFTDSVEVLIDADIPMASAVRLGALNCLENEVILDGSNSSQGSSLRYEWRNELNEIVSTSLVFTTTEPGIFTLRVIDDESGCVSAPITFTVLVDRELPLLNISSEPEELVLTCRFDRIDLTVESFPGIHYTWISSGDSLTGNQIQVSEAGSLQILAINPANFCRDSLTLVITEDRTNPTVILQDNGPLTCETNRVTISAMGSSLGMQFDYFWLNADGDTLRRNETTLEVTRPGEYTLLVINRSNGCSNQASVFVDDIGERPEITLGENQSFSCLDSVVSYTIPAQILSPINEFTIEWRSLSGAFESGENTLNPTVINSGWYVLEVLNTENGCNIVDSIFIDFNANAPAISLLEVDPILCEGDPGGIYLLDFNSGNPPLRILLNGQDTDNSGQFFPLGPGIYRIALIDALGCSSDTSVTLLPGNRPEVVIQFDGEPGRDFDLLFTISLNFSVDQLSSVQWSPPGFFACDTCPESPARLDQSSTVTVLVTDENGCEASAQLFINVPQEHAVFIPNAFTPNSDGTNDFFTLFSNGNIREILSLSIFDRWGTQVFFKENFPPDEPSEGWDGKFRGKDLSPGPYIFHFRVERNNGYRESLYGDVLLLSN